MSDKISKNGIPEGIYSDVAKQTFGEVNMEVSVTADEVMCAGGFGATDDISSILPIASNFTDFEDHIREVQGFEDSDGKNKISGEECDGPPNDTVKNGEAVYMEASVTPDEVTRAGGFGATDGISNFLPVASDYTDFEAYLRDARGYEDLKEEVKRPGLGWASETK